MKEPSVLDYLKSRLNPWQTDKVELADSETPQADSVDGSLLPDQSAAPRASFKLPQVLPWRTFLALALAVFGQSVLDPTGFKFGMDAGTSSRMSDPNNAALTGTIFYAIAALLLIWAYFVNEFSLPALPDDELAESPQTMRRPWLFAALGFSLVAFLLLFASENLFTWSNVTFWLVGLALYLRGMWLHPAPQLVASPDGEQSAPETPRPFTLASVIYGWWDAGLLLLLAFFGATGLGGNIFLFGLLPFLIALAIIWLRDPNATVSPTQNIKAFSTRDPWRINLTRWTLLILAISALVIFFRFYRLDGVPAEPFSDHAEKLLDIYDIGQGKTHIFFDRLGGREPIDFYWTALIAYLFNTGLTFLSLKMGTALIGLLTLPYVYFLGKEIGGKRVALFAFILAGVAYWPNAVSRIGLYFPLYAMFAAPVLFYVIRGLRTQNRNDFILSGVFLGLGLQGYTPFRFVLLVVLAAVGLYLLHKRGLGEHRQVLRMLAVVAVTSLLVFLPLLSYGVQHPAIFSERTMLGLTDSEHPFPAPDWCPIKGNNTAAGACVLANNTLKAMTSFFWDNGSVGAYSVPGRPALDIIAAVLFGFGCILILVRYLRQRRWQDIFLLVSVPLMLLPSILLMAFPDENPSVTRMGGALVVVVVIAAVALDGLYTALRGEQSKGLGQKFAIGVVVLLLAMSASQSHDLLFNKFDAQFRAGFWNTSDMGRIIRAFVAGGNSPDNVWVVPFPYWADTRVAGIQADIPTRDLAKWPENLQETLSAKGSKLFIVKEEDQNGLTVLRNLYPNGLLGKFDSPIEGKDFWIYTVPDSITVAP